MTIHLYADLLTSSFMLNEFVATFTIIVSRSALK